MKIAIAGVVNRPAGIAIIPFLKSARQAASKEVKEAG
jgi:hypothetical protein